MVHTLHFTKVLTGLSKRCSHGEKTETCQYCSDFHIDFSVKVSIKKFRKPKLAKLVDYYASISQAPPLAKIESTIVS